jgi:hypothetical protein
VDIISRAFRARVSLCPGLSALTISSQIKFKVLNNATASLAVQLYSVCWGSNPYSSAIEKMPVILDLQGLRVFLYLLIFQNFCSVFSPFQCISGVRVGSKRWGQNYLFVSISSSVILIVLSVIGFLRAASRFIDFSLLLLIFEEGYEKSRSLSVLLDHYIKSALYSYISAFEYYF